MSLPLWAVKAIVAVVGLVAWFFTQALIARRAFPQGRIGDRVHAWTEPLNRRLREHPRRANALLVVTSGGIDMLGLFLVGMAVFGPSIRPFLGLAILFALRQICQGLCALPAPDGMIWRNPGFPSLLVTYGTTSDLFFSGHTAIAVYGALELAHSSGPAFAILGAAIAVVEAATVLVLRAHYTMDVFTGAVDALWAWCASSVLAPGIDAWLARVFAAG